MQFFIVALFASLIASPADAGPQLVNVNPSKVTFVTLFKKKLLKYSVVKIEHLKRISPGEYGAMIILLEFPISRTPSPREYSPGETKRIRQWISGKWLPLEFPVKLYLSDLQF